jgi:hypothetical protein
MDRALCSRGRQGRLAPLGGASLVVGILDRRFAAGRMAFRAESRRVSPSTTSQVTAARTWPIVRAGKPCVEPAQKLRLARCSTAMAQPIRIFRRRDQPRRRLAVELAGLSPGAAGQVMGSRCAVPAGLLSGWDGLPMGTWRRSVEAEVRAGGSDCVAAVRRKAPRV